MSSSESDSSDDETYVPNEVNDSGEEEDASDNKNDAGDDMKKEEVDKLWESFKQEAMSTGSEESKKNSKQESCQKETSTTVKVTRTYDFAGEEVKVTEEVGVNSKIAKQATSQSHGPVKMKRPGGLQGILGKMSKKPKLSTLEKSKLDWNSFKTEEGIADDLKVYNKGKNGFLEKKHFLERTDNRQFEKEKEMRLSKSARR